MFISEDESKRPEDSSYMVDVLTRCHLQKNELARKTIMILPIKEPGEAAIISIPLSRIYCLSSIRIIIPKDLLPAKARENTLKKVSEVLNRFVKDGMPLLDPEDDMKVQSSSYKKVASRIEKLVNLFERHEIAKSPLIEQKIKVLHTKKELTTKIKSIKRMMQSSSVLAFKGELKSRKRVLRRMG